MAEAPRTRASDRLVITLRAVEKYVSSIFTKLGLPATGSESRACSRCCCSYAPELTATAASSATAMAASRRSRAESCSVTR